MKSGPCEKRSVAVLRPIVEWVMLAVFLGSFPLVAYVSTLPPQRFRNEITQWGDIKSEVYQQFAAYREQFGVNEYVIITWPGCDLNDSRIETVAEKIESELADYVEHVSSGQRALNVLEEDIGLSKSAALKRLQNVFVAKGSSSTAVGFNLSTAGRSDRGTVVRKLEEILESANVDPESAFYAGLGHNLFTMDKEGLESPFRMVPQIMLLAFVLTLLFVRNLWLAFFINALGTFTGCLAFNFIYLADIDMNAIIWPLPTLTMLLTVSASLHFLGYFRKTVEQQSNSLDVPEGLVASINGSDRGQFSLPKRRRFSHEAFRAASIPTVYCTLTTAIGLLSLWFSSSEPVRQFGIFGAISIVAANGLMLIWLPAFLTLFRYADQIARNSQSTPAAQSWHRLALFTTRFRWPIIISSIILLAWSATGIAKIETGSNLKNFFPAQHPVLTDTHAVEQATGPLNSVELLLRFENHAPTNDRLRLQGLKRLSAGITRETPFTACVSAATFAPQLTNRPTAFQLSSETLHVKVLKERMTEMGMLHIEPDQDAETWRVSCRYSTLQSFGLKPAIDQLHELVSEMFYRDGELVFQAEQLSVTATGEFVLFDYIDRQFFRELLTTYAIAFAIIMLVVILVLARWSAVMAGLLPNLFPAIIVLGMTGHFGYTLDVASLMTASVALGIAVDDTLHFLLWHRDSDQTAADSIAFAMRYCGTAMLQTSLILGCSIVLYAFCGFLPTVRFGLLLSSMLLSALIGDLILLPALLSIGRKQKHNQWRFAAPAELMKNEKQG